MTSTLRPSSAAAFGRGEGHGHQRAVDHDGGVGSLAEHVRFEGVRGRAGGLGVHLALEPVAALGFEDDDRVLAVDRLLDHPVGVMRVGRGDDAQAGGVGEQRLGRFGVVLDRTDAAAVRDPDDDRYGQVAVAAGVHLGQLRGDLVEAGEHKAVELDFADGLVAAQGESDRRADDAGLRQRGIHDAVGAEFGNQAVSDAVDAAEGPDVLAHQQATWGCWSGRARRPSLMALAMVMVVISWPLPVILPVRPVPRRRIRRCIPRTRPVPRPPADGPPHTCWRRQSGCPGFPGRGWSCGHRRRVRRRRP